MRSRLRKLGISVFVALACAASGRADDPFATLSISPETNAPGSEVPVEVVLFNSAAEPVSFATPAEMEATLIVGEKKWTVTLKQQGGHDEPIAPGKFSRRPYTLRLPDGVFGLSVLEVEMPLPMRGVVAVAKPPAPAVVAQTAPPPPPPPPQPEVAQNPVGGNAGASSTSTPSAGSKASQAGSRGRQGLIARRSAASHLERSFSDHFSTHEPVYFIAGTKHPEAKFQISFKYRITGDSEGNADGTFNSFQFGYTQRSLWALREDSSPFYDSSYIPELFYEFLAPETPGENGKFTFLGVQTGYMHESNGREGLSSRSINTLFVRPAVAFGRLDGWRLILAPRAYEYAFGVSDNPDIKHYRGYGEMRAIFGKNDGPELSLTGRVGSAWDNATYQADLTIPVKFPSTDFASYLLFQYFDGYGESLLTYKDKSSAFRIGFSFVR